MPASAETDRKSTRLNSSHLSISYAVFCLKKRPILMTPMALLFGVLSVGLASGAGSVSRFDIGIVIITGIFFFNDSAPTEISTLSQHDALPICDRGDIPDVVIGKTMAGNRGEISFRD